MSRAYRTVVWAFCASASLSLAAGLGGCKAQPCGSTSLIADTPSPALECPSGDLCYRGACIRACSAGQERGQTCTADSQCDSARPRCVDGYCSICDIGELCVPTLNICQAVEDVPLPEIPKKPMAGMRPPGPLDAGDLSGGSYLDGGLSRVVDAGPVQPPAEVEVTHVGFLDLGYEDDLRGGGAGARSVIASVVGYDVRGIGLGLRWRAEFTPPRIQCRDDDNNEDGCGDQTNYEFGSCTIRGLRTVTASTSERVPFGASVGPILIDSHPDFPNSLAQPLNADFMQTQYVLTPSRGSLGASQFALSVLPIEQRYLSVTSRGEAMITAGSWPNSQASFLGHHVPFLLEPRANTLADLSGGAVVTSPPADDLVYQWDRIDTGDDNFERVVVRIVGADNELFCSAEEGQNGFDSIVIPSVTLSEWRNREPAGTYSVYFERVSAQQLPINPAMGLRVDVTVRVRHTLIGQVEFQ